MLKGFICNNYVGTYIGPVMVIHRSPHMAEAMLRGELNSRGLPQHKDWKPRWRVIDVTQLGMYVLKEEDSERSDARQHESAQGTENSREAGTETN